MQLMTIRGVKSQEIVHGGDSSQMANAELAVEDYAVVQQSLKQRRPIDGRCHQVLQIELQNSQSILDGVEAGEAPHSDPFESFDVDLEHDGIDALARALLGNHRVETQGTHWNALGKAIRS